VPAYISAQLLGATLASGTLKLIFSGKHDQFSGNLASGSNLQAFVLEFIVTFFLMFTISGVATDNRAIGELAGIAIGSTLLVNVIISGPITGASMNPVRSLGPAFVHNEYTGIWIFIVSPILGAVAGAWVYNTVRYTNKSVREITKSASFLKEAGRVLKGAASLYAFPKM
ncbi:aquaporin nip1-2, partial [Trifolium pratense]